MANKNKKEFGKRIADEAKGAVRITNDMMRCKDCIARYDDSEKFGNTSICEVFREGKPNKVLLGGNCDEYIKEG